MVKGISVYFWKSRFYLIGGFFAAGLLASFLSAPVHAQSYPTQYLTTVWQTEQGLPQNSVNALLQDHDGYLWIGTFGGLARFDGERFKVFDSAGTPGFGSNQILSLYESRSGVLWIGTVDGGLIRLENGVATTYTERDGLPSRFIASLRGDAEGNVWIKSSRGVAKFAGAKLAAYPTHRGKAVKEFYLQARDGSMWFRCGTDLVRFGADGSLATLKVRKPSVFLVQEARDGSVWVAVRDEYRLVRYDQGVFSDVPLPPMGRRALAAGNDPEYALTMAEGADGELLLYTPAGLVRIVDGRPSPPQPLSLPANGGELPKVRSLLVDREGNLWVGMVGPGLLRLRPAPLTAYAKDEGLSDSSFNTVFQDREGRIWLGGDGLYWLDGHRFHRFPGVNDILTLAQTGDGDLWFGGYSGLYRWRSGVLSHFQVEAPAVGSIYQDREGTLWIGGFMEERPGGLYRFREGKLDRIPGISGVAQIIGGRAGGFWVAALEGLFEVRGGKAFLYAPNRSLPGHIVDIDQDSSGTLWLATYGGGLFRFRDGRWKAMTTKDGLPNNMLLRILEDGEGNLWFTSTRNIFRLSRKELNDFAEGRISSLLPVSYGVAEGMRSSECNGGSPGGWKTRDGRIWFPTLRGVVAIDPTAGSRLPPPVVLEEAWANQLTLARDGQTSVPPGNNTFDFRFTALSFSAPEKLRFKYRLEPFDKDWVDAGTRRTAHYTNMAPGKYSFQVAAANNYGIWNEQGARVRFVLQPHFYQTNGFRALCAAVFLGLLWTAYQFRVRQLHHQFEMTLEARVGERTRIARELHDTLLQSFHGLLLRFQAVSNVLPEGEAKKRLESAIDQAAQAITEGRDAIQGLRSSTLVTSDLAVAVSALGDELAADASTGNSAVLSVHVEGTPRNLHPILRDEVYRIAGEALRNASQHAQARRIEVEIRYDDQQFRLRVRDDGKGIDPKVLNKEGRTGHFGLRGMRERAKLVGGQLDVWSEVDTGTEVELTIPASVAYAKAPPRRSWFTGWRK